MRVLIVLVGLAVTPFVAGVSQSANGSRCNNGQSADHRSAQGQANAHHGQCGDPPAPVPTCGTAPLALGSVSVTGKVYNSTTGVGLPGWCVVLSGTASATALTDSLGNYTITGLPAGTYTICETLPSGSTETFPGSWSGATCTGGFGWTFSLLDGESASFLDFGNM